MDPIKRMPQTIFQSDEIDKLSEKSKILDANDLATLSNRIMLIKERGLEINTDDLVKINSILNRNITSFEKNEKGGFIGFFQKIFSQIFSNESTEQAMIKNMKVLKENVNNLLQKIILPPIKDDPSKYPMPPPLKAYNKDVPSTYPIPPSLNTNTTAPIKNKIQTTGASSVPKPQNFMDELRKKQIEKGKTEESL